MDLLHHLFQIQSPSGEEFRMKEFLLQYVKEHAKEWKVSPRIVEGDGFQDALMLIFGKPRTAIFAHMDTVGFTVRYGNQLVPIGGPEAEDGFELVGVDPMGPIQCRLKTGTEHALFHDFPRGINRGTSLVFRPDLKIDDKFITSPYCDNRLGMYNALKVAETLEHGVIVFSCNEEHGGGSVPFLIKFLWEEYKIQQCLISDITWITDGVKHGEGVVISMRDRNIPRRSYLDKIIALAEQSGVSYQLEVEGGGSSDGREIQESPFPVDWCFVGAAEDNVHSPHEKVHKDDLDAMIRLYKYLMQKL
ncbi:MAG: M20/M25/M40 family metallo-hydrolase [Cyclobacteriaceae bacterium]|nr:M20/M25/M40 family metallo-hydrolase [Cyclobacteriaceae bacterium HetDA_MAG_MS6]